MLSRALVPCLLAACLAAAGFAAPARALIFDATTIDGPSADVLDLGGVAMSEDGTGGLVYRKRVNGRAHIFVSQLDGGKWLRPQRVDVGPKQSFDSSWPRIAAGDGGRLLVIWVQEFGTNSDRLFSATLDPGATEFQAPVPVDLNVGEATGTYPSLAMNRNGAALAVYRVLPDGGLPGNGLPPGYVRADLRVARFNGQFWSVFGQPLDRNDASPVRIPTPTNAPQVGIDLNGNGIVAFQEPDDDFVDRIWARRIFSNVTSVPLLVSPQKLGTATLRAGADQFALDVAGFGQGAVAFRQQPGQPAAFAGPPRVMEAQIPDAFTDGANAFGAARFADGAPAAGLAATPSAPAVAVTGDGAFEADFGAGTGTFSVRGDETTVGASERLDDVASSVPGDPQVDLAASGASVSAWKVRAGARGAVAVRELGADGVEDDRQVFAVQGGPVSDLRLGGSGLGDGAIGFFQGSRTSGQIAGALVDAPPTEFAVQVPLDTVTAATVPITWDRAQNAITGVRYSVTVDDEVVADGLRRRRYTLRRSQIDDGRHVVRIVATDGNGQDTTSFPGPVRVDRTKPTVALRAAGRRLRIRIADGADGTGVEAGATAIAFGDGRRATGRRAALHRYRRPGTYRVVVRASDRAGNRVTVRARVQIR